MADKLFGMKVQPSVKQALMAKKDSSAYQFYTSSATAHSLINMVGIRSIDSSVMKSKSSVVAMGKNAMAVVKPTIIGKNLMPLLKGMVLKEALSLCESSGLKVTTNGEGRVISQSIEAGMAFKKGQAIHLILENTYSDDSNEATVSIIKKNNVTGMPQPIKKINR